jgi:prepilin peptidase CpaA
MLGDYLHSGLLAALAIALVVAAATDWRRRQIDNRNNHPILIGAPK